jgi:hypothetical protein
MQVAKMQGNNRAITGKGYKRVDYLHVVMLGTVGVVLVLIYVIWREVDVFVIELDREVPPQNLFEIIECNNAMQIIPIPEGVSREDATRNSRLRWGSGSL